MAVLHILTPRDNTNVSGSSSKMTPTMLSLLVALICIMAFGCLLVLALFLLRAQRKARQLQVEGQTIPQTTSGISSYRRLTITAAPYGRNSAPISIYGEKEMIIEEPRPVTPSSPIPEIRITFPEEKDESGKAQAGRQVIVRISETGGVGLEPYNDEHLPPYQKSDAERFESLDLERIGGLKEKS